MVERIINLPKKHSFFLFGARSTGKSTWINHLFGLEPHVPKDTLYIDLLDPDLEMLYQTSPNHLKEVINEKKDALIRVIIDEVQKAPALLDVVHSQIEKHKKIQFVLAGSSARKLKRGTANLLGGRAFSFRLHPYTHMEAPNKNNLIEMLAWGTIPQLFSYKTAQEKKRFLRSYTQTYLKEEIQVEQLVRNVTAFRQFLEFSAQCNGQVLNFSKMAKQTGVDEKTISRFFEILSDTMLCFFLEPFDRSVRARQAKKPKFYLFDTGVQRQLAHQTEIPLQPSTSEFGNLFEQFIILECFRLNDYYEKDFEFFYLRTKDDVEVDLIIKKPGGKLILIEIKSGNKIYESDYRHLIRIGHDLKHEERMVLCCEKEARKTEEGVRILPWRQGLQEIFKQ